MATQLFVNIPVKDLKKSVDFFTKLGFSFNPQFTDEKATCMIINEGSYFMLLLEDFFKSFTSKKICDSSKDVEAIFALSTESRAGVDAMVEKALAGGATLYREPQDYGYMYQKSFQDLDGHLWEVFYMDLASFPKQTNK